MQTTKYTLSLAIVAVAVSFGARLGFIVESRNFPDFRTPTPGMDVDLEWNAVRLLRQKPIAEPTFELHALSAPFNTTFLSVTRGLLGESLFAHRILYAGIASLASALLFGFTLRVSGRPMEALVATVLMGMQPTWIYLSTLPLKTAITVGLGVALLWTAFEISQACSTRTAALLTSLHLCFGVLLFLTQMNTLLIWGSTTLFILGSGPARRERRFVVAAAMATCGLVVLALSFALGRFIDWKPAGNPQAGIHTRVGFHTGATGYYSGIRGIPPTPIGHSYIARMAAEIETGRPLTFAQANAHHLSITLDYIANNTTESVLLVGRKILLFFNDFAPNGNYYLEELRGRSRILATLPIGFGVLIVCASWGVLALVRKSRWNVLFLLGGAITGVLAANLATFVTSRYRISAMAPLAILSTIGLSFAVDRLRNLRTGKAPVWRIIRDLFLPGLAATLLVFTPVVSAEERASALRTATANLRRSERAESLLARLSVINTREPLPADLMKERGFLLLRLQRFTEAFQDLERVAELTPDDPQVLRQLLAMTVVGGDYERAIEISRQCRRRFRWNEDDFLRGQEEAVRAVLRRFILPRL